MRIFFYRFAIFHSSKGMEVGDVERWLGPVLNYVPTTVREDAA